MSRAAGSPSSGSGSSRPCGIGARRLLGRAAADRPEGRERRVEDFDPLPFFDNPKEARRTDRFAQFALAAAAEAWEQAGSPDELAGPRAGTLDRHRRRWPRHARGADPGVEREGAAPRVAVPVPMMMANVGRRGVSMRYGLQGPCENTVTACAAGTHSIGNAARLIADGRCDLVVTGGSEAAITPIGVAAFGNMTALSISGVSCRRSTSTATASSSPRAPACSCSRSGSPRSARGATILAEVLGSASTADAHHITAPSPGGEGAIRCMELALDDAGLEPGDITQINAHGTSTPLNDAAEAEAIAKVFGEPGPAVTSIKGVTGHSLGAAGAIEAVAVVLSMQHREIPPTMGLASTDPELPEARPRRRRGAATWEPGPTLSNSFGFGGHNGSVVFGPPPA